MEIDCDEVCDAATAGICDGTVLRKGGASNAELWTWALSTWWEASGMATIAESVSMTSLCSDMCVGEDDFGCGETLVRAL